MPTLFQDIAGKRAMDTQESAWLSGRELLVEELDGRVAAMRNSMRRVSVSASFRTGLVVFLERRLEHLREALEALRHLPHSGSGSLRQTLDRMVSAVVGTLRHAEVDAEADGCVKSSRNPAMTRDQHPVDEPKPEPEPRREKPRQPPRRKGARSPVPSGGESDSDSQADGDVGDGS